MKSQFLRGLTLATLCAFALGGCAGGGLSPDIGLPPEATPRPVELDDQGPTGTYSGDLPTRTETFRPTILAGGTNREDALGEPQFVDLDEAVRSYGETRVRRAIGRNIRVCYKVEVQKWAAAEARRQAAWTKGAQVKTRDAIKNGVNLNYGLAAGSAVTGFFIAPTMPLYGILNLFGAAQGANSNRMWSMQMAQNDRLLDLNSILVELHLGNTDLYLESLGEWCPQFESWVTQYGTTPRGSAGQPQLRQM